MGEIFYDLKDGRPKPVPQEKLPLIFPGVSFGERISDNLLSEIGLVRIPIEEEPEVNPWQISVKQPPKEVDGEWSIGWSVVDLPLEDLREEMLKVVESEFSSTIVTLTGNASVEERDTWRAKEEAARDYLAGKASQMQLSLLQLEATFTGEELEGLSERIIEKAAKFYRLTGLASGVKRATRKLLLEAENGEQIYAALEQGKLKQQQAMEMISNV